METVATLFLALCALLFLAGVIFVAATWKPEKPVGELTPRWAKPPSKFISAGGMKVHLRDEGPRDDPSPIVLLHGTGSSLHAWDGWAAALREHRRVIRYDMAGFGLTGPSPDGIYNVDRDAELLVSILDTLHVRRCILGGNSLGGTVAWRAALAHPERVSGLILVDAGGYGTHAESSPIGMKLLGLPGINRLLQNTLPRFLVEQGYRNVFGDPDRVTPEMVDRSMDLTQRQGNRRALIDRAMQRTPGHQSGRISELKLPALILWGGRDRLIPPSDGERFHREIAGSTLIVFQELGHAPEEEDPARTVAAVKQFLRVPNRGS
jgi:pimeloyl-ACP methyl ester carboxylesterase